MTDKIGIIGIGYVGLPLALIFAKKYEVVAFDKEQNQNKRIKRCLRPK